MNIDFEKIKSSAAQLAASSRESRDLVLTKLADSLVREKTAILAANQKDMRLAKRARVPAAFLDRLELNERRISQMIDVLKEVRACEDPIGRRVDSKTLKNGIRAERISRPLGVVFLIFESRPNVAIESFALAIKAGNALILKGGRESIHTTEKLYSLMKTALRLAHFEDHLLTTIKGTDRSSVKSLLKQKNAIDVVIPRGGEALIRFVSANTDIPLIKNDRGLCHLYVDSEAKVEMAVKVAHNAKIQRSGVCNAIETLLVHRKAADVFYRTFLSYLNTHCETLELRVCSLTQKVLKEILNRTSMPGVLVRRASSKDWKTEHLDLILNCKVVENETAAREHIAAYGSKHSEAIITENVKTAEQFLNTVDAAVVYWNASTRFTDGHELGLGGEIGISTQKLHVRGPVGLEALTCNQWVLRGNGQIRT